jgi:hypothetical protein
LAVAGASTKVDAFLAFFAFLAFGAGASADGEAAGAEVLAEADGAAVWLAAKADTANRPAIRVAIRFFVFVVLRII